MCYCFSFDGFHLSASCSAPTNQTVSTSAFPNPSEKSFSPYLHFRSSHFHLYSQNGTVFIFQQEYCVLPQNFTLIVQRFQIKIQLPIHLHFIYLVLIILKLLFQKCYLLPQILCLSVVFPLVIHIIPQFFIFLKQLKHSESQGIRIPPLSFIIVWGVFRSI